MKRITTIAILFFALFVPAVIAQDAGKRQPKPLTTAGLAKSLLTLAEKAQAQGMTSEAEAIMSIIPAVLAGTPVDKPAKK